MNYKEAIKKKCPQADNLKAEGTQRQMCNHLWRDLRTIKTF